MAATVIQYNAKTITLWKVGFIEVQPRKPQTNRVTRTGVIQVLLEPRMDISIVAQWRTIDTSLYDETTLKMQFANLWQWALAGNQFSLAVDSSKVVDTTLSAEAVAGATSFTVANPAGIAAGIYRLFRNNKYQTVKVSSVGGSTVNISEPLDFTFPNGAIFRDQWFFQCRVRDPNAPFPIRELPALSQSRFEINLNCYEAVV